MNALLLFHHSLVYGLWMSFLIGILVIVSQMVNAEMWLDDYPPEIQEKFGSMSGKAKKQKGLVSIFFLVATLGPIIVSLIQLNSLTDGALTFALVFWNVFIMMLTFNLFDLLILDWLIFATLTPDFIILPGTEGHPAYKDFVFHAKGFGKGIVFAIMLGALAAGISLLF